jgi:fructoselysine-6-P-deglycase FrlB-like protein
LNSIEAMAQDIGRQLDDLPRLALPAPAEKVAFVGSGDSYAAALAACYLSSGRAACWRPTDVISDPSLLVGRSACFVSISGRTRSNIQAASAARKAGVPTVAITADGKSPLASACDSVFALDFKSAGKTSGTISFAASILACTHLATQGKTVCPADLKEIYARASKAAGRLAGRVRTGSIIMLGDSFLFSAAMYGALKFNEVFGSRAQAYPLEEFFHAPLFGLKRNDQVIVLGTKGDDVALARRVNGLPVDCSASVPVESLFYAVFFIQHLVLAVAKKRRLQECHFMRDKRLLKTSSKVIY